MNRITIHGRTTRDCEMRYTPQGTPVSTFTVASDDGYGEKKQTLWFRVTVWNKLAETCNQYLTKGKEVIVIGRMTGDEKGNPRTYQRKDGTTGSSFEVTAQEVIFVGSKGRSDDGQSNEDEPMVFEESAIPF